MLSTHCFAQMSTLTAIDEVHPVTGLSGIRGETLERVRQRYPGAEIMTWDDFIARKESALTTTPTEIDEERWFYALEVLPPHRWDNGKDWNSFHISEAVSGNMVNWYIRHAGRYWECCRSCFIKRESLYALVMEAERELATWQACEREENAQAARRIHAQSAQIQKEN